MYFLSSFKIFDFIKLYGLKSLLFCALLLLSFSAKAQDKNTPSIAVAAKPNLCWTPAQLLKRRGKNRIQSRVQAAFRMPPIGKPQKPVMPSDPRSSQQWRDALGKIIRHVKLPKGVRKIALTFDLCEQPHEISGYQGTIVDFLRKQKVKATFFSGGKWLLTHKDRAQQLMADPLFEVANHSWEHRNLRLLKGKALSHSIEKAQLAYNNVRTDLKEKNCLSPTGQDKAISHAPAQMSLFRFPFGACNKAAIKAVADAGLLSIQWDVSAGDPVKGQTARHIKKAVLSNVKPGSIVIFHANGRGWHTPKALPAIIKSLKNQGYSFVTVQELLNTKGARWVTKDSCYDHHPGDSERYDKIAHRLHAFYARATARHYARHKRVPYTPKNKIFKIRYSTKSNGKNPKLKISKKQKQPEFSPFETLGY